jgi:plastocyanin
LKHFKHLLRAGLLAPVFLRLLAPAAPVAAQTAVSIEMTEMGNRWVFAPNQISVPAGQVRITFRNTGMRAHNWVVDLPGGTQRLPDLDAGQPREMTFNLTPPGTYDVICDLPLHAQRGMTMTLVVTAPAAQPTAPVTQATTSAPTAAAAQPTTAPAATPIPTVGTGGSTTGTSQGQLTTQLAGTGGLTGQARSLPLLISLMIHIPTAILWLGLVLYDAIVVAVPFLTPAQRGSLLHRPRWLVLVSIPVILTTGIYQTIYNPINTVTDIASLENLRNTTTYGFALFLKHGFVLASWAMMLAMTYWFAPRLVAFADDIRPEAVTPSRLPGLLAWANVAACIGLLTCVAVMVFQLH